MTEKVSFVTVNTVLGKSVYIYYNIIHKQRFPLKETDLSTTYTKWCRLNVNLYNHDAISALILCNSCTFFTLFGISMINTHIETTSVESSGCLDSKFRQWCPYCHQCSFWRQKGHSSQQILYTLRKISTKVLI